MWYREINYNHSTDTAVANLPFESKDVLTIGIFNETPCSKLSHMSYDVMGLAPGATSTKWMLLTEEVTTIDCEKVGWCKNEGKLYDDLQATEGLLVKCLIAKDPETMELIAFLANDFSPQYVKMLRWCGYERNDIIHFDMKDNHDVAFNHFFWFKPLLQKVGVDFITFHTWLRKQEQWKKKAIQELNEYIPTDVARTIVDIVCG
jgi:hypothetical protein